MYGKNNLRVRLAPDRKAAHAARFKAANYARFHEDAPAGDSEAARTWYVRGPNLIVAYSAVGSGATFARKERVDRYAVLLRDAGMSVQVTEELGPGLSEGALRMRLGAAAPGVQAPSSGSAQ